MNEPEEASTGYCSDCRHLADAGSTCELRQVAIPAPQHTGCASHPRHGQLRRAFAIGPIVQTEGEQAIVLQRSPDDPRLRDKLLDLIENIQVYGTRPLSARDSMVVWQLREFGEPRAFQHLDRIDAALVINRARADGKALPTFTLFGAARQIVARTMPELARDADVGPHAFLSQFTLAGRLLLLSTILVACGVFATALFAEAYLSQGLGSGRVILDISLLAAVAAMVAALWLWAGRRLLRWLDIPVSNAKP